MKRKKCRVCGRRRMIKFFSARSDRPGKTYATCKDCMPEQERRRHLWKKYGITIEEYDAMYKDQNGCCAVCGRHSSEFTTRLAVEHRHDTGLINGLVCFPCNKFTVGRNKPELLRKAAEYLENPPALKVIGERKVPKKKRRRKRGRSR